MQLKNSRSLFDLAQKVAVVTGAGSGLGKAMAESVAEAGANVACIDINLNTAKETSDELRNLNIDSIYLQCDVGKEKEVKDAFRSIEAQFGKVDILFNNAGIAGPNIKVIEMSLDEWSQVINTDLTGMFLCAKEAIRIMSKQKSGKIINTTSIWAFRGGYPFLMVPPYRAAKGALVSLTQEMALECSKDGINVNAIAPGFFVTNISSRSNDPEFQAARGVSIPLGRMGIPEDLKGTALFLASAASDYLTGTVIVVDGGYMCR